MQTRIKSGNNRGLKDSQYHDQYLPADTEVVFHEGLEGLDVIKIPLPKPPDIRRIEGYGLPPLEQKFRYTELPRKLKQLDDKKYLMVDDYWNEIEKDFDYFKDDFWFIEREWFRRRFGHWVFIKGKPTWIPPWLYMYLNYHKFENEIPGFEAPGHPEYRDRDRKLSVGRWYAATTTEAPFLYRYMTDNKWRYTSSDKKVYELREKNFEVEKGPFIVDMGVRTVLGTVEFKPRRGGYTSQCAAISNEIVTRMEKAIVGLQSMTETKAKDIWSKNNINGIKGLPFFFIPVSEGIVDPEKVMKFKPALKKSNAETGKKLKKGLYGETSYGSSVVGFYDGLKLKYYLSDEFGKTVECDVLERTMVVRKCLSTGNMKNIIGYSNQVSTAGEFKKGGGSEAKQLANLSHWGQRNELGQTDSGYINMFIPSDEGLEGYIDEWGFSKKEEAREAILARRASLIEKQQWEKLNEEIRQAPLEWKENFISNNKQARFNAYILEKRHADLTVGVNPHVVYGRFAWEKCANHNYSLRKLPTRADFINKRDRIIFIPEPMYDYSWELSWMPNPSDQNRFIIKEDSNDIIPFNITRLSHGVDTFKYGEKTSDGKGSLGGGAIFRRFDPTVDNPLLDPLGWNKNTNDFNHVTGRFCGVYLKRPPQLEEFLEQQLMAALFFGMQTYPEMNLNNYYRWVRDREFPEYLFYDDDVFTGQQKKEPGAHTNVVIINTIFNAWAQHIEQNGLREVHPIFIKQCLEIEDSMTDYDAFTAGGYALMQSNNTREIQVEEDKGFDASEVFRFEALE